MNDYLACLDCDKILDDCNCAGDYIFVGDELMLELIDLRDRSRDARVRRIMRYLIGDSSDE